MSKWVSKQKGKGKRKGKICVLVSSNTECKIGFTEYDTERYRYGVGIMCPYATIELIATAEVARKDPRLTGYYSHAGLVFKRQLLRKYDSANRLGRGEWLALTAGQLQEVLAFLRRIAT